jgi:hypothetical protein
LDNATTAASIASRRKIDAPLGLFSVDILPLKKGLRRLADTVSETAAQEKRTCAS